jgi:hypothetical protein
MRVRTQLPRWVPGRMLGFEKPIQLLICHLDVKVGEKPAHEPRILHFLDRAGCPKERLVVLPEVRTEEIDVGEGVAPYRLQPGALAVRYELLIPDEVHERMTPVEEHGSEHSGEVRVRAP